ncbi:MAG: chromate transporter [Alphaproteobacteria bacterium]|nr:chromate transporter [Alphaproteobacteria bacterium]
MIYLGLYAAFFIAGTFAFGGGFAIIPFLNDMIDKYHWFTNEDLTTIIALSELTPGAIGVNMATYGGFLAAGFIGALCATLGLVTPALIIVCLLAHVWKKIKKRRSVISIFNAIKASVAGLLFGIFLMMIFPLIDRPIISEQNLKIIVIFGITLTLARFRKLPVFIVILSGAVLGILFNG